MRRRSLVLRARAVLPIHQAAIANGAVVIQGGRIHSVCRWKNLPGELRGGAIDLGETIIMPGLVNSHCHLDYTDMAGEFPPPRIFTDWLKLITTAKGSWRNSDYAKSWSHGAEMLLRTGTTTVGDIEAVPELLPEVWQTTPLRVISYLEMIGITPKREPAAMVKEAVERCRTLKSGRCRAGLSPHAPYSTTPALLALSAREARRKRLPYTVHIAESALEYEMFTRGKGGMHDWLRKSGRDCSDCKLGTPVQQLERNGALNSQLLAVHVNYLGKSDAKLLGKRGVSVVHCPRSHGYFRHERFPFRKLHKARVNICLGTDSLASVYKTRKEKIELNMFEEMRSFAEEFPGVSSKQILRMATSNGARALGLEGKVGALENQAFADLISIPFTGSLRDAYDIVLHHSGEVADSFIGGKRVFGRG